MLIQSSGHLIAVGHSGTVTVSGGSSRFAHGQPLASLDNIATAATVATETDGNGVVTSYSYDTAGNLTGVDNPAPLGDESLSVDSLSRVVTETDGKGQVTT